MNMVSWQLPALMLTRFFSATVAGHYSLGLRVLQMPMSLVGAAISQVFFQRAAELRSQNTLTPLVENAFRRLVFIGLPPMLVLGIIGRELFSFMFGANWMEAGIYVQILSIWTFFWFISSPLSNIFTIMERQDISLKINICNIFMRFLSLWIGGICQNPRLAIVLFASLRYFYIWIPGIKGYINGRCT